MKTYQVEIKETLRTVVEVEADNAQQAEEMGTPGIQKRRVCP